MAAVKKKTTTTTKTRKRKPGRPPKVSTVKGTYKPLIREVNKITVDLIDKICNTIADECVVFEETACVVNGLDDRTFERFKSTKSDLALYAIDAIKQANSKLEEKLMKEWLDKDSKKDNKQAFKEFLEKTNPKFSKRHKIELNDNLRLAIIGAKQFMTHENWLAYVHWLSVQNSTTYLEEFDKDRDPLSGFTN